MGGEIAKMPRDHRSVSSRIMPNSRVHPMREHRVHAYIFILMSSPLIVPRNESRTFRVCAFPSSRSLSPSTFFFIIPSPASTLFIVSLTRTRGRRITETDVVSSPPHSHRRRPPQLLAVIVIVIVIVLTDGNPTFPRNPCVADERGVIPACVRI